MSGSIALLVVIGIVAYLIVRARNARRGRSGQAKRAQSNSLVIPRNYTNSLTRAEEVRDWLYERFDAAVATRGVQAVGYKSYRESGEVWFRFDFRLPSPAVNLSLRSSLAVTIERFDYHQFELLLSIEIVHGARTRRLSGLIPELSDSNIGSLVDSAYSGVRLPKSVFKRVRRWSFEVWQPGNAVKSVRPDWRFRVLVAACIIGLLLTIVQPLVGLLVGLPLLVVAGAILAVYLARRKTFILSTGKPMYDPRAGIRLDYWQANVERLGQRHEDVRADLLKRLSSTSEEEISVAPERIWYAGVDGKVEREQIVVRFRRAIGYVHIESYGEDLYVGWDTYVNSGTWVEETLSRGIDRATGVYVVANRVVPGIQRSSEYDVDDVNFLTEWLHATIVRTVRLEMEEMKIDQEIDFTIQRESRNAALGGDRETRESKSPASRFTSGLRRIG
ncbi:hypothetical protein [Mycobacterium sp.]|uniref:hypothetical protein n=1 Tax=Mycobacterium sp. TaxID=1785 RepID=UPI002B99C222|nr:hypothetical protein [Mycobacterium sp.]HTY31282.1 hypothetical protein [Mycobacterium sp.]